MALQSSGAISFANLQTEFGGSHPITMGEYSAFRVSGSGNTISMDQFYGAAGTLDTQTVTVGYFHSSFIPITIRGYSAALSTGAISDGTSNIYSGASISALNWTVQSNRITLQIAGNNANSGWTTMTLNGVGYTRTSASYSVSGNSTYWFWGSVNSNPWGVTSGDKTVEWT